MYSLLLFRPVGIGVGEREKSIEFESFQGRNIRFIKPKMERKGLSLAVELTIGSIWILGRRQRANG